MKSVLILEDDLDLCELLVELFTSLGSPKCTAIHSVQSLKEMLNNLNDYQIAILDVNLGANAPDGIAGFGIIQEHGFSGEIIFFTGHASSDVRIANIAKAHNVRIIEKPASLKTLSAILLGN